MVGLGESFEEMVETFGLLREHRVQVLTVGQYLRPTEDHLPVERYWHPEEFEALEPTRTCRRRSRPAHRIGAVSRYELLLFLHISASIIWLGAGFLLAVLILGAELARDHEKEAGYHRDVGWLAPRLFIPASLSVLVLGILLVLDGPWGFDQLWITIALTGWAISFLLGILYFKPEGERIGAIAAERGPHDPELNRRLRRLNVVDRVQLLILFLVVADMVLKPTGDDGVLLAAGAAILVAGFLLAFNAIRRHVPVAEPSAG